MFFAYIPSIGGLLMLLAAWHTSVHFARHFTCNWWYTKTMNQATTLASVEHFNSKLNMPMTTHWFIIFRLQKTTNFNMNLTNCKYKLMTMVCTLTTKITKELRIITKKDLQFYVFACNQKTLNFIRFQMWYSCVIANTSCELFRWTMII